jgi:phage terminase large subunit-like protein
MSTPTPTEREIQRQFEKVVQHADRRDTTDVRVLWGVADPEHRPEGVTWVPETNTLTYDLWYAQRRALDAINQGETDIVAFLAGYGSGKTIFGARWLITQALQYGGSRFLAMGIDFTKARDTTFRVLFEQLPGDRTGTVTSSYNGPETSPVVADYNRQSHRLTFTNDSVIKLGSADRWNRYAGDSYGALWLDEPSHYGGDLHDLLEMLGSRLRGESGPKTQLWTLTGNGHNAAFDIIERKEDSTGDALGLKIDTIQASTLKNPYLSADDKERFKRQYANTSREQQALHGGFAAAGGNLLSRDMLSFTNPDSIDRELRFFAGVDLGLVTSKRKAEQTDSDYTALVLAGYDSYNDRAYLLDTWRERGLSLNETVTALADLLGNIPNPHVAIEAVGGQTWLIDKARNAVPGRVTPVNPTDSKAARITDMGVLMESGQVKLLQEAEEIDDALGYAGKWEPFVREWCQFSRDDSHDSDDLLDAAYYALDLIPFSQGGTPTIYTGDPYDR